jgi:hypothetical protein
MLKPVAASNTANMATWNQSIPKYQRYSGTAVSVRINVPIKNELVVQLMRSFGMRKSRGENRDHQLLDIGRPRITSLFVHV